MSIRQRLVLLVLAVLLPALAAALWVILRISQSERETLERNARDTTRAMALLVDREFTRQAAVARALAGVPRLDSVPQFTPASLRRLADTARRMTEGTPATVRVAGVHVIWLDTTRAADAAPRVRSDDDLPLRARPAIELVPATGREDARVAVIEPVPRSGPDVRLNVVALLPVAALQRMLEGRVLPPGWAGLLLDGAGRVVVQHPADGARTGLAAGDMQLIGEGVGQRAEGMLEIAGAAVPGADPAPGWRAYFHKSSQGWTYVTTVPAAQLKLAASGELRRLLAAAGVLLVVAVGWALWVARGIARPVEALEQAARQLQTGRPVAVPATGIRECDQVAAALHRSSAALLDAHGELERQVAEAVERTRLAEQRAFRRERSEMIGRLTGRVAHEFNNLLGVISNSAHLINRHADDPKLRLPAGATLRAVEAASRLTQQLLRIGARQSAQPRRIDLASWLPGMQQMLAVVLGKRIALHIEVAEPALLVSIDPDELEFGLINVVMNAREALGESGHVDIRAACYGGELPDHLRPGDYVEIRVADDGRGMTRDQAARVFEPFFSTKEADPSAGFGLSQVQGLCAQAGGEAWLESRPGGGTVVSLLLPLAEPVRRPGQGDGPGGDVRAEVAARGAVRVLLVEDNIALGDVTAALIESAGAVVERAADARQALARLERPPHVDVLLSDVVMPGEMDGIGLARAVRVRWPQVHVVLISAHGSVLAGVTEFPVLRKPCTPGALFAALRLEGAATTDP